MSEKKEELHVSLVQSELYWEQPAANRAHFEELLFNLKTDVVVLPEMFTTGFHMQPQGLAEVRGLTTEKWMLQMAAQLQALVVGSYIVQHQQQYFNALLAAYPNGQKQWYHKRHLFRMAGEHKVYAAGEENITLQWQGWQLRPQVCYDLRFPVWSRNVKQAYDALLYVANWPAARVAHWDALLKARAIENAAYCIGVNRTGTDGNEVAYCGHSAAYNFKGNAIFEANEQQQVVGGAVLSAAELEKYREAFPVHLDSDAFELKL